MNIRLIRTTKERHFHEEGQAVATNGARTAIHVVIDPKKAYQTHLGFGGAITEATAYTMKVDMPKEKYDEAVKAYFSSIGLGYSFVRIHMNSCDFSLNNYAYVKDGDKTLSTFDISHEDQFVIPFLKDALQARSAIKVLVSPWSPPAYMKTNNDMNHGGKLLPEYYATWAQYFVRFIKELNKRGIEVWGVTVQNEPAAVQTWDSCIYTAEEERDFVKNHLGPALHSAGLGNVKILIWDHNLDILLERAVPVLADETANKYVWGTAFHWYGPELPANLSKLHSLFPDKHLLFTEGCIEGGPRPGAWATGERYARNIINDFNHGCEGFIDWNLVLNEQGGPNHVGNYCDAPLLADRQTKTLTYNSSYYYIGHFSRYILPGAVRIDYAANLPDGLRMVSYRNPHGEIVLVVQNENDTTHEVSYEINGHQFNDITPRHSITTFLIEQSKFHDR